MHSFEFRTAKLEEQKWLQWLTGCCYEGKILGPEYGFWALGRKGIYFGGNFLQQNKQTRTPLSNALTLPSCDGRAVLILELLAFWSSDLT